MALDSRLLITIVCVGLAGCSSSAERSPAETQAGSAAEQSRGPVTGAEPAACKDLPSVQ